MREPDGSAAISGGSQVVAGNGYVWGTDNVSEVLEPSSNAANLAFMRVVTPEGLADRAILPFARGYRRIGTEVHGGVKAVHYRASPSGAKAYADTFHIPGPASGDLWIASDGGHLLGARITGTSSHVDPSTKKTIDDSVLIAFEVTDPGATANGVKLPATPVPDPIRPTGPPVDLKLAYRVAQAVGASGTPDLEQIGVILRYRLEPIGRPIKVDVVGTDRVVVTICGTTRPEEDRRLITAAGALNVVPLPATGYGSLAAPGSRPLPAIGSTIDPALEPVAPPAGAVLTTAHVDPATGKRGLAVRLGNTASDAFRSYAAAHPGEYVAVVLDGVVLAVLPIEGVTAKGSFVFTGDYTVAESRRLASWLYRDPITAILEPIDDVEVPSR